MKMDPATVLQLTDGAVTLLQGLLPTITQLSANGEITPEQQSAVKAQVDALRNDAAKLFDGPEWQLSK